MSAISVVLRAQQKCVGSAAMVNSVWFVPRSFWDDQ